MQKEKEYAKILERMEKLLKIFDDMKKQTAFLKKLYQQNPKDESFLKDIKLHEENYKQLYEEFEELNKKVISFSNK